MDHATTRQSTDHELRSAGSVAAVFRVAAVLAASAGVAFSALAQDSAEKPAQPAEQPADQPRPAPADKPIIRNIPIGNAPVGKSGLTESRPNGPRRAENQPAKSAAPAAKPVPPGQPGANPNGAGNAGNAGQAGAGAGAGGANAAGGQPGDGAAGAGGGENADLDLSTDDPNMVTLADFSGPIELTALVELVAKVLNINVVIHGELTGTVVFNAPVRIKKDRLLGLLDSLLEQQDYTITFDEASTFYNVVPQGNVAVGLGATLATTRVFSTPNIRPSALKAAIEAQVTPPPPSPTGGQQRQIAYIDELGVIVATDTPRRLAAIGSLVDRFLEEFAKSSFIRLELDNIAAPVARERALQLIGQAPQRSNQMQIPGMEQMQQPQPSRTGVAFDNLGDRLTVDPQGNALIFRGLPEEIEQVQAVLAIIDVTNVLVPKQYFAGNAASQIADIARQQGLGEVTTIEPNNQQDQFQNYGYDYNQVMQNQMRKTQNVGGPVMVVDESRGTIIYYGTAQQHELLDKLIEELDLQSEKIVIRAYKLKHSDSEELAEVILGLLNNQSVSGESPLLPDGGQNPAYTPAFNGNQTPGSRPAINQPNALSGEGSEDGLVLDSRAFVIADIANNQVLVKAPSGQQDDFKKLIEKLDLRRPQVYIEAQIVAVTTDDRLRLAFETQLINANGTGGVINTNFGLGSFAEGDGQPILSQKIVGIGTGFTGAIIRSSSVPIIMQALANETDSRVIASPRILVDDNEEASIVTTDEQPVTTISRGNANQNDVVTSDYVEAETNLTVTPKISEGGYLRLAYEITLSTFTGEAQTVSGTLLPPPRTVNVIQSESITIPHDGTVVVGGLVVDQESTTIAKIPLLGDIPIIGPLFQSRNEGHRKTVLYVFLTPRILRDPEFDDLRLLTAGPAYRVKIPTDIPEMEPTSMDLLLPLGATPVPGKSDSDLHDIDADEIRRPSEKSRSKR